MTNDSCAACHKFMDPLGFPLENFDAIGKYRTTDNGLPVDPTGSFDGVAVADANGLGVAASQSVTVAQCLVRKYYAYAVGHEERDVDGSVLNTLATAFKASGFKMRDLILAAVDERRVLASSPRNPKRTVNPMAIKTSRSTNGSQGRAGDRGDGERFHCRCCRSC